MTELSFEQVSHGQLPLWLVDSDGYLEWDHQDVSGPAVIAHDGGRVVGLLAYGMSRRLCLNIYAIWVSPRLRRSGLAKALFYIVTHAEKPRTVRATVITSEGLRFLEWVRESFKGRTYIDGRRLRMSL